MKLHLSPEIIGKPFQVFSPFIRYFAIIGLLLFSIATVGTLVDRPAMILLIVVAFLIDFLILWGIYWFWNTKIIFTEDGFSEGSFRLKETCWNEINEVLRIYSYYGMTTLALKMKNGKLVNLVLPTKNGEHIIFDIKQQLDSRLFTHHFKINEFKELLWPKWGQIVAKFSLFMMLLGVLYLKSTGFPPAFDVLLNSFVGVIFMFGLFGVIYALVLSPLMSMQTASVECSASKLKFTSLFLRWSGKINTYTWNEIDAVSGVEIGTWLGLPCHSITITSKSGKSQLKVLNPKAFDRLEEIRSIFNDRRNSNGN